ncbi:19254_t:CDS:2, partial [Entrophospora sp. SA101]
VKVTSSRSTHCLGELLGMTRWKEDILVYEAEEACIQDELSRLQHKLSEIQEKVKMQNSSNREMDEDS